MALTIMNTMMTIIPTMGTTITMTMVATITIAMVMVGGVDSRGGEAEGEGVVVEGSGEGVEDVAVEGREVAILLQGRQVASIYVFCLSMRFIE